MADGSISDEKYCDNKEREFGLLTISLYKDHPELWNPKCCDYSNKFIRRRALQTITEALKQFKPFYNEQLLRRKINILRTNFNKEYKKKEQMRLSGHDYEETQSWYYEAMMFIKDESYAKTAIEAADGGLYKIKPAPAPRSRRPKKRKLASTKVQDDPDPIKLEQPETSTETLDISDSTNDSYPTEPEIYNNEPLVKKKSYRSVTEHDAVGINVAKKLAKMDTNQAIIAENIINNVLRRGLQHKLNDDTDLCDIGCSRVKYTLDNRILIKKT